MAHGETSEMETTQGYPGNYNITWELPYLVDVSVVGNVYKNRIHPVDKFYPDAYILKGKARGTAPEYIYRFHVISEVAGVSNLLAIHDDYINVFGCIYDDIWHTRPSELIK